MERFSRSSRARAASPALAALLAVSAWGLVAACGGSSGEKGAGDAGGGIADGAVEMPDAQMPDAAEPEPRDAEVVEDAGEPEDAQLPEPGRDCRTAMPLSGSEGETELIWAAEDAPGRYAGTCGGDGAEYVFSFTITQRSLFDMRLSGDPDGVLYLRKENCADSTPEAEAACSDGVFQDVIRGEVPAGTHYVFADAFGLGAEGPARLEWAVSPHPCNDVQCAEGAECDLDESSLPTCVCPAGQVYGGLAKGCADDPCLADPCAGDITAECGWTEDSLPSHVCLPRQWTVLVFMSADNNLNSVAAVNLEQMRRATLEAPGGAAASRIVVLLDGNRDGDTGVLTLRQGETVRLDSGDTFLGDRTELNMSEGDVLRDFGAWAVGRYPARHYALVLWDHGSGWKGAPSPKGFSNDVTSNPGDKETEIFISTGEYGAALEGIASAAGARLDLVAFDACLMGMYEVALATAPYASYLLASEERIPSGGYDYRKFLGGLFARDSASALEWAGAFPAAYIGISEYHYTLALTDLSKMAPLAQALDGLGLSLADEAASEAGAARLAEVRDGTLAFNTPSHLDLGGFASKLAARDDFSEVARAAAREVVQRLGEAVAEVRSRGRYLSAQGLAIYFPELAPKDEADCPDDSYFAESAPWHGGGWERFLETLRCGEP